MPSSSKAQAQLMRAACHNEEFAKKKKIDQEMACHWVEEDTKKAAKDPAFAKTIGVDHAAAKAWIQSQ